MFAKPSVKNPNSFYLAQCSVFLMALVVIFSLLSPFFLSFNNFNNILTANAVIGLMALGATFVIASGGIDLSSAAVMALVGTVCAYGLQKLDMPPILIIAFSIGVGGLCGFLSGLLINLTGAPSFIITLGMMSIARAAGYIISNGMPVYGLPNPVITAGQGLIASIPVAVLLFGAGVVLAYCLLQKRQFGTHTLFLGDSLFAAEAMGVPVKKLRLKIYTLAGLFSGLAGIIFMLRTNSGDPSAGQSYELIAITAVIVGGANLFGGRAAILGTVLGVICLGVLQNGLNLLAVSAYYQILFVGLVLVAAAFLSRLGSRK